MAFARRSRLMSNPSLPLTVAVCLAAWFAPVAFAADEQPKKDDDLAKRAYDLLLTGDEKKPPADAAKPAAEQPKPAPAATGEPAKPAPAAPPAAGSSTTPGAPWPDKPPTGAADTARPKPFVPPGGALPGSGGTSLGSNTPAPRPASDPKPDAKPEPRPAPKAPPTGTEYTIKAGDTFSSIAVDLYGDEKKWSAIAQANPLVDPTKLKVGQVIRLPDLARAEQDRAEQFQKIAAEVAAPNAAAPGAAPATITVQPGDTLSHIAQRVYGKARHWRAIYEANRDQLETPDSVKVGQKLKIPPKPADEPAKKPS